MDPYLLKNADTITSPSIRMRRSRINAYSNHSYRCLEVSFTQLGHDYHFDKYPSRTDDRSEDSLMVMNESVQQRRSSSADKHRNGRFLICAAYQVIGSADLIAGDACLRKDNLSIPTTAGRSRTRPAAG